ncbi:hypothetical protein L7F22_045615 [Adiantum nelumboides]|nr:hypothetical protein [Adiantum nelumboides]
MTITSLSLPALSSSMKNLSFQVNLLHQCTLHFHHHHHQFTLLINLHWRPHPHIHPCKILTLLGTVFGRFDYNAFRSLISDIIMRQLSHNYKVFVTEFPVSLMKNQQKLENMIHHSISNGEIHSIGIVGMGGIGKTTLVSSNFYNKFHGKFKGSVLLLNVRQIATHPSGVLRLQQVMIKALLGDAQADHEFHNVSQGIGLLSQKLRHIKALIILDDVDNESQRVALFPPLHVLGPGSLVIVTTRNRDVLINPLYGVNKIYEMDLLDSESARILFYWQAFMKPFPPDGLQDIAQKVIDACKGLPLSLKVIGAHVYGHTDNIIFWKETLLYLRQQGGEIFKPLKVSVDALESQYQEAFIDVCCFLIGKPVQTVLRYWKSCGWSALACLNVLKNKCLIAKDAGDGRIGMHDQIWDIGRQIAAQQSVKTHLWDVTTAADINVTQVS